MGNFSIIVTEIELASFTRGHNLFGFSPDSNTNSFLFSEYRTDVIHYQQIIYVFRIWKGLLDRQIGGFGSSNDVKSDITARYDGNRIKRVYHQ